MYRLCYWKDKAIIYRISLTQLCIWIRAPPAVLEILIFKFQEHGGIKNVF
mgnify:FL=1